MRLYRKAYFVIVPMIVVVVLAVFLAWRFAQSPTIRTCPTITGGDYTPSALLECANRLIQLGPQRAYQVLRSSASDSDDEITPNDERVALLCRVLYCSAKAEPLRPPNFGRPFMPERSMPNSDWQSFPLEFSDGVPFLLVGHYRQLGLITESGRDYLDYCYNNGVFRTNLFMIPDKYQALNALGSLLSSDKWKAIEWKAYWYNPGNAARSGYAFTELFAIHRCHLQISRMGGAEPNG